MLLSLLQSLSTNILYFMLHLTSANSFPKPLSAKEEQEELIKFHTLGDINARNRLVNHNMRLVAHIIKKYYSNYSDQEDIISIGTIGLIKAINTFDYTKGTRLATYASRCIENEILMYIRKISNKKTEVSLDEPINMDYDGNELLLSDLLGTDSEFVNKDIERAEDIRLIRLALSSLEERERIIIELRFGINTSGVEKTQKKIDFGVHFIYNIGINKTERRK